MVAGHGCLTAPSAATGELIPCSTLWQCVRRPCGPLEGLCKTFNLLKSHTNTFLLALARFFLPFLLGWLLAVLAHSFPVAAVQTELPSVLRVPAAPQPFPALLLLQLSSSAMAGSQFPWVTAGMPKDSDQQNKSLCEVR